MAAVQEQVQVAVLCGVGKQYHGAPQPVLSGVDLSIRSGDLVAIAGGSGAGKTTLLNILGCIDSPTAGSYYLDGKAVQSLQANQLAETRACKIGFVFQSYFLIDHLTVEENLEVRFLYGQQPVPADFRARARAALDQLGILELADTSPRLLSGGEMQRVAIARATVAQPLLLLADEPTGNLDPSNSNTVFQLLERVAAAGTAVVLVTHDPILAKRCRRRFCIDRGKLHAA